jgi:predicted permease
MRGNKIRTVLVVSEVGLSLVLLIGAGLMLRSFSEIQRIKPGFNPENVLTFSTPISFGKYVTNASRGQFTNDVALRLAGLPSVEQVGGITPLPLGGGDQYSVGSYGRVGDPDEVFQTNVADYKAVIPGYFEAMEIPIVSGRSLMLSDNEDEALGVVVIDEKLAQRVWPDEDPLGKELVVQIFGSTDDGGFGLVKVPLQVVGIAAPVRAESLTSESRETLYFPFVLNPWFVPTFTVKTSSDAAGLTRAIRQEIATIDPEVPVIDAATMESFVSDAAAQTRFMLTLVALFAGLALLLASLGLYGVISYSVRQRTREIGVRVAFGAGDRDVLKLVLSQGLAVAVSGILVGLLAAFILVRLVESLLVGVSTTDPMTFVVVPALLLAVSVVASYVPARRAMRVDPVEALRDE